MGWHSELVSESTIQYVYSWEHVIEEIETINGVEKTKEYIYWNGGVDDIVASIQNNSIYYYHKDQVGSVVGITDGTWNLVSEYNYDVF